MLLKNYKWILFDADETLFHFNAFDGLQHMFVEYNVDFTIEDYHAYQAVNKLLWVEYQNGIITAKDLQIQRFSYWAEKLNCQPEELNSQFLTSMAKICRSIEGAVSLLKSLQGQLKLGIITNGFTQLQQVRLESTGLKDYFDIVVISEEVGVAKPHSDIFNHALNLMGNPPRENVLMVGDSLESDILGGLNAGFATCWLNMDNKAISNTIIPHYQVSSLAKLEELLFL